MSLKDEEKQEEKYCALRPYRFPKSLKIRKSWEYRPFKKSLYLKGQYLVIKHRHLTHTLTPKMGLTVSKKFGKAHERNRFKRLVREIFRTHHHLLNPEIAINIYPRSRSKEVGFQQIRQDFLNLCQQLPPSS